MDFSHVHFSLLPRFTASVQVRKYDDVVENIAQSIARTLKVFKDIFKSMAETEWLNCVDYTQQDRMSKPFLTLTNFSISGTIHVWDNDLRRKLFRRVFRMSAIMEFPRSEARSSHDMGWAQC